MLIRWEKRKDDRNRTIYVNHSLQITQLEHPSRRSETSNLDSVGNLRLGEGAIGPKNRRVGLFFTVRENRRLHHTRISRYLCFTFYCLILSFLFFSFLRVRVSP